MKEVAVSAQVIYRTKSGYFFSSTITAEQALSLYRAAGVEATTPLSDLVRQVRDSSTRVGCYVPAHAPDKSMILVQLGDITEFSGAVVTEANTITL